MNAPAPEADNEYSRGPRAPRGPRRRFRARSHRRGLTARWASAGREQAVAGGALIGAIALVASAFATLYTVHTSSYGSIPHAVTGGSHNAYSLVPIGLLGALLGLGAARRGSRAALLALAVLGLIALVISLVRDLPDTSAHGITSGLAFAGTTLGPGMYLETLGAVVLLATGGSGLLAVTRLRRSAPPAPPDAGAVQAR